MEANLRIVSRPDLLTLHSAVPDTQGIRTSKIVSEIPRGFTQYNTDIMPQTKSRPFFLLIIHVFSTHPHIHKGSQYEGPFGRMRFARLPVTNSLIPSEQKRTRANDMEANQRMFSRPYLLTPHSAVPDAQGFFEFKQTRGGTCK
jgi:hypothetical protein